MAFLIESEGEEERSIPGALDSLSLSLFLSSSLAKCVKPGRGRLFQRRPFLGLSLFLFPQLRRHPDSQRQFSSSSSSSSLLLSCPFIGPFCAATDRKPSRALFAPPEKDDGIFPPLPSSPPAASVAHLRCKLHRGSERARAEKK